MTSFTIPGKTQYELRFHSTKPDTIADIVYFAGPGGFTTSDIEAKVKAHLDMKLYKTFSVQYITEKVECFGPVAFVGYDQA